MGFCTTIEKAIAGGQGSVDVALERDTLSIACEISVTSTVEYELGNLQKCLDGKYSFVLMIGTDAVRLKTLRDSATAAIPADAMKRARLFADRSFRIHSRFGTGRKQAPDARI